MGTETEDPKPAEAPPEVPAGPNEGAVLLELINERNRERDKNYEFTPITANPELLAGLKRIDSVVIVGPAGSHPEEIYEKMAEAIVAGEAKGLSAPQQIVPVAGPASPDIVRCGHDAYDVLTGGGQMGFRFDRGQDDSYAYFRGFDGNLPVYADNDVLHDRSHLTPPEFLDSALLLGVYAPENLRAYRLSKEHGHYLHPAKAMPDLHDDLLTHTHVRISNNQHRLEQSVAEGIEALQAIVALRKQRT